MNLNRHRGKRSLCSFKVHLGKSQIYRGKSQMYRVGLISRRIVSVGTAQSLLNNSMHYIP